MGGMMDCTECGYSTDTERGLNIHFGRIHGRKRECKECGGSFTYHPSQENKFCSDTCYRKWRQNKSEKTKTECEICGHSFSYHPTAEQGRFCSRRCFYKAENVLPSGEDHFAFNEEKRLNAICKGCGKKFEYDSTQTKGLFCSVSCLHGSDFDWNRPGRDTVERKEYECYTCGSIVERLECDVVETGRVFCDNDCRSVWISKSDIFKPENTVYVEETDREVRSGWEADIDRLLYRSGFDYTYESKTFDIGRRSYTPDFIVGNYVIEVKGRVSDKDVKRAKSFMKTHPKYIYVVVGSELPSDVHIPWKDNHLLLEVIDE